MRTGCNASTTSSDRPSLLQFYIHVVKTDLVYLVDGHSDIHYLVGSAYGFSYTTQYLSVIDFNHCIYAQFGKTMSISETSSISLFRESLPTTSASHW